MDALNEHDDIIMGDDLLFNNTVVKGIEEVWVVKENKLYKVYVVTSKVQSGEER